MNRDYNFLSHLHTYRPRQWESFAVLDNVLLALLFSDAHLSFHFSSPNFFSNTQWTSDNERFVTYFLFPHCVMLIPFCVGAQETVVAYTEKSQVKHENRHIQLVREYGFHPRNKASVSDGALLPRKFEPFPENMYVPFELVWCDLIAFGVVKGLDCLFKYFLCIHTGMVDR